MVKHSIISAKTDVVFIIMYDISDEQTRNYVARELSKLGCLRIQRSVFIGNLPYNTFQKLSDDLRELQQTYDNEDSYILVPLRKECLDATEIIGKEIDWDMLLRKKSVLFLN